MLQLIYDSRSKKLFLIGGVGVTELLPSDQIIKQILGCS